MTDKAIKQIVDHCLDGAVDLHVVIGPPTWQPADNAEGRRWYLTIATSGPDGFRADQVICDDLETTERARLAIFAELIARRPRVAHDVDDELAMARLCEVLWPGERITQLRQNVERERSGRPH
jgi:hypothetical protein